MGLPLRATVALAMAACVSCAASELGASPEPTPAEPPSASDTAAPPRGARPASGASRGVAVLVVGDDEAAATACRELARRAYRSERLRPSIDEPTARALCAGVATEEAAAELGELRRGLAEPLEAPAARALLEAIARRLPAEGLAVVERRGERLESRVWLVDDAQAGGQLLGTGGPIDLGPLGAQLDAPAWAHEVERRLPALAAPTTSPSPPSAPGQATAPSGAVVGPRRKPAPSPPPPSDDGSLTSSPWFWVAAGSVAAVGLGILIASLATADDRGSVRLEGRVLP